MGWITRKINNALLASPALFFLSAVGVSADSAVGRFCSVVSYADNAAEVAHFCDEKMNDLCDSYNRRPVVWHRFPVYIRRQGNVINGWCEQGWNSQEGNYVSKVQVNQNFPGELDYVLPHELTHAWTQYCFGLALPLFLDESFSTTEERSESIRRTLDGLVHHGARGELWDVERCLRFQMTNKRVPTKDNRIFYGSACAFATFLTTQTGKGKPEYFDFCWDVMEGDLNDALKIHYGITLPQFNQVWHRWIQDGCRTERK